MIVVASSQPDSKIPNCVSANERNRRSVDDEASVDVKSGNLPSKGNSISRKKKTKTNEKNIIEESRPKEKQKKKQKR